MSLQLNLNADNQVTVTNSITQEKKVVTLTYIQKITRNSLDILIQYKAYEVIIDAQNVWNQIKHYDAQYEVAQEIELEKKYQELITPGSWIEISDYEYEQYNKALLLTEIYNPNTREASSAKVIKKLQELHWEITDLDSDYITMHKCELQSALLIPNRPTLNRDTLAKVIKKTGLSISEFFLQPTK